MMEGSKAEQIRKAYSGGSRRIDPIQTQIDRVRREIGELAEMLGSAAQGRLSGKRLLSRAEAMRTRAANQVSTTAGRASETARDHPVGVGLAVVLMVSLIALLLSRR